MGKVRWRRRQWKGPGGEKARLGERTYRDGFILTLITKLSHTIKRSFAGSTITPLKGMTLF
jgi:hypothetical protein